jgi:hypothetical protein
LRLQGLAPAERRVVFELVPADRKVVDAGDAKPHQAVFVEFPVSAVVMPLACSPSSTAIRAGSLAVVLQDFEPAPWPVSLVYPENPVGQNQDKAQSAT